jgi:hypothetical protein
MWVEQPQVSDRIFRGWKVDRVRLVQQAHGLGQAASRIDQTRTKGELTFSPFDPLRGVVRSIAEVRCEGIGHKSVGLAARFVEASVTIGP